MTIAEAFEIWLNVQAGCIRPVSLKSYRTTVEKHLTPDIGDIVITGFTPDIAGKHFVQWRLVKTKSQIFEMKKTLAAMLNHFIEEGIIAKNPVKRIYIDKTPPDVRIPTQEEIRKLLAGTKDICPYYPHFLLLATTGMRVGELRGLRVQDLDSNRWNLSIRRVYYNGNVHETKTKSSRRAINFPAFVGNVLVDHIAKTGHLNKDIKWIFPNNAGRPVSHQYLGRALHGWQDQLNLPRTKLHAFRHAHATFLLENGRSLKAIQQRLGWASPAMLLERYAHVTESERQELIHALDKEFNE